MQKIILFPDHLAALMNGENVHLDGVLAHGEAVQIVPREISSRAHEIAKEHTTATLEAHTLAAAGDNDAWLQIPPVAVCDIRAKFDNTAGAMEGAIMQNAWTLEAVRSTVLEILVAIGKTEEAGEYAIAGTVARHDGLIEEILTRTRPFDYDTGQVALLSMAESYRKLIVRVEELQNQVGLNALAIETLEAPDTNAG